MRDQLFQSRDLQGGATYILFLLVLGSLGCSTSYVVTPTKEGGDYSYDDFNTEVRDREAIIMLRNEKEIDGLQVHIRGDSIFFVEPVFTTNPKTLGGTRSDGIPRSARLSDVQRISWKNHAMGALEGLGFGALGGLAILVTIAATGEGKEFKGLNDALEAAPPVLIATSLPSAGIGALIGHSYRYEFPADSTGPGKQ